MGGADRVGDERKAGGRARPCRFRVSAVLFLVLAFLPAPGRAALPGGWPWPWHSNGTAHGGEELNEKWAQTLTELWDRSKDSIGFCVGRSQYKAQRLMALSFPWPLPVSVHAGDGLCGNRSRIDQHLCGPLEIDNFYRFMLLTDNVEKIPDNVYCSAGGAADQPACTPGFFDAWVDNRPSPVAPQQPAACCEGYFCPAQLTCMIPCPLGAYCPRAWPAPPPSAYKTSTLGKQAQWCAPYAYKERSDLGCGGADKWRIIPGSAFPTAWWTAGSGSIFCDGGYYCPNTTARLNCSRGHFCRQGEVEPERCPPGASCPPNTEIPESNYTGATLDLLLFGLLWVGYIVSQRYNRMLLHLNHKERLKIIWGASPEIRVVKAAPRSATPPPASGGDAFCSPPTARKGLLGILQLRSTGPRPPAGRAGGQVWAAFRGPHAEAEADHFTPLLGQQEEQQGVGAADANADAVELSQSAIGFAGDSTGGPDRPGLPVRAARVPANITTAIHHRMGSIVNEDEMTPHHLHSCLVAQHRQSLLSSPLSSVHAGSLRREALCIEFQDLGLRLRSYGKKAVLQGVTGVLPAGRVTAIMGPSGAGKTSLLNVLAGKAQAYGSRTGAVFVNGRLDKLERYKSVMGFVPQDDIMHGSLTVFENLMFSARFRLPARCRREEHLVYVERAINVLQLEDVRDCQIGNEEKRGISGGQRKRVNVGLELVADPLLLLLDEPTSGLDSTASKALVAALQAVARSGVTATAVVHQPSWQTCQMFQHLLLLGKGGRTVYCGAMADAQPYFEGLGFQFPAHQNPADAFMDIISGELVHPGQATVTQLFDDWDEHCGRAGKAPLAASPSASELNPGAAVSLHRRGGTEELREAEDGGSAARDEGESGELLGDVQELRSWRRQFREAALFAGAFMAAGVSDGWQAVKRSLPRLNTSQLGARLFVRHKRHTMDAGKQEGTTAGRSVRAVPRRIPPGFLPQFWWCLGRAVLKRSREPLTVFTDYAIFALTGMALGLISDRGRETIMHFAVSITYSVVALGLLSTVGALNTFSRDRVVFYREAASGLNRLAYFLALDTFDHAGTVLRSAVYFFMYYSFASPRAVIWQMLLVSIAITYCCTGVAYLLSQVMEPSAAQLSAAVFALVNTLIARQSNPGGLLKVVQLFGFARWGLEGYVIAESNKLTGVWLLARCADLQNLHYDVHHFSLCLLALFGLGLAFRAAALIALLTLNQDKQR